MRINFYGNTPLFRGRREDRNTVSQLKQDNAYALTEPNQRKINTAIENLQKYSDKENVDFLLDVAEHLRYGTGIQTGKTVKNDWQNKLKNAAETVVSSNPHLQDKYIPEIQRVFYTQKPLTEEEKQITNYKKAILERADLDSLKNTKNENIRELERNMDYFISSSEIPTAQKLYVLKRLDYMMSPDYKINPQLKDKKTQILAEMMNDLTINTAESKVPNIKAINQKNHGMCAAISITRKAIAYEDKPNYVDSILSELDATDNIMIYDRFNLGSGKRIPVKKAFIDFDYAQAKGYRIVDAAATQWMNIADMYGINNENLDDYNPFDKLNFDAFQDAHFMQNFSDEKLMRKQCYYQALSKAQDDIGELKSDLIKNKEIETGRRNNFWNNLTLSGRQTEAIRKELSKLLPALTKEEIIKLSSDIISLQKPVSEKIKKANPQTAQYSFIPNEENSQKIKKIKEFIIANTNITNSPEFDKAVERITDSVTDIHSLGDEINPKSTISGQIGAARKAYEAEASYRASILLGLSEIDTLTDYLIRYNIPDKETRIINDLEKIADILDKTDNHQLQKHFASILQVSPDNKQAVVDGIHKLKSNYEHNMTVVLDQLYDGIGLASRAEMLLDEIEESKQEILSGKKSEQARVAEILQIKDDKTTVLNALNKFEAQLSADKVDEKTYNEIFNKAGYKSQINVYADKFQEVLQSLLDENYPNREENLKAFKELHELDENASMEDILNIFRNIGDIFNKISSDTEVLYSLIESAKTLDTPKNPTKGGGLGSLSVNARDTIIKEMEKRGELIPASVMKKLQDRFVKIDKIRSTDEFSSRQGKISQPELYKLSNAEKDAIKQINKKVNKMYANVTRAFTNQYREIKPELEEMARYVGTNKGSYWVTSEGHSGLYGPQEVKIFEQITDRPYYEEEDLQTAVDKILKGTHSGVSCTSVFHDRIGGHAQYVADIRPHGPSDRLALFHDNTWGASEHENTWIDSEGITRTDYSDRRGGELGYITNSDWRNGNYIENLASKKGKVTPSNIENKTYKRIKPSSYDDFNFSLVSGILINGQNSAYKVIAAGIKDTLYIPDETWMGSIERQASKMTVKELEKMNLGIELARKIYNQRYDKIMKRLEKTPLSSGINSKEDFDKLSDNDEIKLIFTKLAVKLAYPNYYMSKEMAAAKTLKDIQKIEDKLKQNAKDDFNYAFGKTDEVLLYYAYEHARNVSGELLKIFDKYNVKYDIDTMSKIFQNTAVFEDSEKSMFTGSLKDSINFVINKTLKQFDEIIPSDANSQKAKEEFKTYLTNFLNETMYFNENDLKSGKFRAQAIRNWIDRTFNPATDEEFVKIYRRLQDMTTEEFEKQTSNLTAEDLGIKNLNGWDIIKQVKANSDRIDTQLRNTIFMEEYSKEIKMSHTKPSFKYQKNQKSLRGAIYTKGRTFDDLYLSFRNSMDELQYERLFAKYKDRNFRKHKAMPAYPKVELYSERIVNSKLDGIEELVNETLIGVRQRKILLNTLNAIKKLEEYTTKIPDDKPLSKKETAIINQLTGEFITNNYQDPDIQEAIEAANEILNLPPNTPAGKYKPFIKIINDEYKMVENSNNKASFKDINSSQIKELNKYLNISLIINIPPRFHDILKEDLNNWINEEYKKQDRNFTKRQKDLQIRSKLDELSIPHHTKAKLGKLIDIQNQINIAKLIKNSEKYDSKKFEARLKKANQLAETYVNKFIKPEYRNQASRLLTAYIKTESGKTKDNYYDPAMSVAAKLKFEEDFKKYNYGKYPLEAFKSYLNAHAKDSKIADYKTNFKNIIQNHLNFATMIDIQELLMEAVEKGNAAEVKQHFKDYYVYPFNDGFPLTMDSPESISYMVKHLLINNNNETAKMFVEKLGLAEEILKFQNTEFDQFEPEKHIRSISNILMATKKNLSVVRDEIDNLNKTIDKSDNFERLIDSAKQNIITKTKGHRRQAEVKLYLQALDEAKERLSKDSYLKKSMIVDQYINAAVKENTGKSNEDSREHQEFLNMVILLYSFLGELSLPEYSEAYKVQQELNEKFLKFRNKYEQTLIKLKDTIGNLEVTGI